MAQFAQLLTSGNFASGVTYYHDYHTSQKNLARMVLIITVEGRLTIEAIVDTGAPWCVLDPAIVKQLGLVGDGDYESDMLMIRGVRYKGRLLRMEISLEAEQGNSLDVESTVFVPVLTSEESWPHPNFIGLDGFLNRIRFAVDPLENAFYFGPLG